MVEYKPRDDDHLPATRGQIRRVEHELYNVIKVLMRVDMTLNPCPLKKEQPHDK